MMFQNQCIIKISYAWCLSSLSYIYCGGLRMGATSQLLRQCNLLGILAVRRLEEGSRSLSSLKKEFSREAKV